MPARCAKHGLAVAPDGTCVRCRNEETAAPGEDAASAAPTRSPIVTATLAIVLLGIGGIAIAAWTRHAAPAETAATASSASSAAPSVGVRHVDDAPPLAPLVSVALPPDPSPGGPRGQAQADRLAAAMHRVPITLYSRANDGSCRRAREWLLANGYPFTDRDIDRDPAAASALGAIAGDRTVPILVIGGQPVIGFDPERVTRAIEYAGAQMVQH